jgi:hypothetical protein
MISGSRDDNAGSVVVVFGSFGPFTRHNIRGWRALNHLSVDQPRPHKPWLQADRGGRRRQT